MGRQIQLYTTPEDRRVLLRHIQERDPIVATLRDSESPRIEPLADLNGYGKQIISLWNQRLLPSLEREWVPDPGYFRINTLHTPTLEFSPSFEVEWEGKPALVQGRLFGDFDSFLQKPDEFKKWFESLVRWIRKNYRKSPANFKGFLGPEANEFYQGGGYLLPQFLPPRTDMWLREVGKQHSRRLAKA